MDSGQDSASRSQFRARASDQNLDFVGGERYIGALKARRWSWAEVIWEMSVKTRDRLRMELSLGGSGAYVLILTRCDEE